MIMSAGNLRVEDMLVSRKTNQMNSNNLKVIDTLVSRKIYKMNIIVIIVVSITEGKFLMPSILCPQ